MSQLGWVQVAALCKKGCLKPKEKVVIVLVYKVYVGYVFVRLRAVFVFYLSYIKYHMFHGHVFECLCGFISFL